MTSGIYQQEYFELSLWFKKKKTLHKIIEEWEFWYRKYLLSEYFLLLTGLGILMDLKEAGELIIGPYN